MGGQSGLPFSSKEDRTMDYRYIIVALIFIVFDVVTGVLQALINGTFKSHIMRKGGFRKLCLLVVIAFGVALDYSQTVVVSCPQTVAYAVPFPWITLYLPSQCRV